MSKHEKIIGASVWALRGAKKGTLYINRKGFLLVADTKTAIIAKGHHPTNVARVEIIEPRRKTKP